jgi:hypothetical protein
MDRKAAVVWLTARQTVDESATELVPELQSLHGVRRCAWPPGSYKGEIAPGEDGSLHSGKGDAVSPFDDDLRNLGPEDMLRVRRWIEDRFVNAVYPLAIRLMMENPRGRQRNRTVQEAKRTVDRVLEAVEEVRKMAAEVGA